MSNLQESKLFSHLQNGYGHDKHKQIATTFAANLPHLCDEAATRMKAVMYRLPQYTLHDDAHLSNVVELMGLLIPDTTLQHLNPIEIALLILAAYYHDQGMVISEAEYRELETKPEFVVFRENWILNHPNYRDIRQRLSDRTLSDQAREKIDRTEAELRSAMLTDYIRETHGGRSADFIKSHLGNDKRVEIEGVNLADLLSRICHSHVQPLSAFKSKLHIRYDDRIGQYSINSIYLALILRLADLLDFDRERTPDSLFQSLHFTSNISLTEWEKHRSVVGWEVSPKRIRYTMQCEHPAYQKAAYSFMDYIDAEVYGVSSNIREFPTEFSHYQLLLPLKVDRDRIEPSAGKFIYHDLEFTLSRNEIVQLLMTNQLYSETYLCVRELLQNSLDALRHRKAMRGCNHLSFDDGKVRLEHFLNDHGNQIVRCVDNGVGMTEDQIERFLTKAGRSYYRSPEFDQERLAFKAAGVDFDPCARFGIGFMSCFMLGDRITVYTRKDYGSTAGYGDPIIVEIDGLSSILTIRSGSHDQPVGTTVEIQVRDNPFFYSRRTDKVMLAEVVFGYAVACEFPIEACCTVPGIEADITIPSGGLWRPTTNLEMRPEIPSITVHYDFSKLDARLSGQIRESFLCNAEGKIVLDNGNAQYKLADNTSIPQKRHPYIHIDDGIQIDLRTYGYENRIAFDGILVSGAPIQLSEDHFLSHRLAVIGEQATPFILDVRGDLKARLTPARTPTEQGFRRDVTWGRLDRFVRLARGRIWAEAAKLCTSDDFCSLMSYHKFDLSYMPIGAIWSQHKFPIILPSGELSWLPMRQLGNWVIEPIGTPNNPWMRFKLRREDGATFHISDVNEDQTDYPNSLEQLGAAIADIVPHNGSPMLSYSEPENGDLTASELKLISVDHFTLHGHIYRGNYEQCLYVGIPIQTVNRRHPFFKLLQEAQLVESLSPIQSFARFLLTMLNLPEFHRFISGEQQEMWHGVKQLGCLYRMVNWADIAQELHPPYRVWLPQFG